MTASPEPQPSRRTKAWTALGALILLAVLCLAVAFALATGDREPARLKAIGSMAGICLAGSLAAWFLARSAPTDPGRAVAASLGAVFLRLFPPLAALGWLQSSGREFRDHGAAEWLLVFYLSLLATDILLHMMVSRSPVRGRSPKPRGRPEASLERSPETSPEN